MINVQYTLVFVYLCICDLCACVFVYLYLYTFTIYQSQYIMLGPNIKDKQQLAQRQAAWVSKVVAQSFGHNFPVLPMDTVK